MDEFQCPQNRKRETKHKKRLSQDQVRLLETNFYISNKLEPDRKSQLAHELGVPARQVAVWYQNKRAREKSQSLEVDHNALKLQLESVLEDNARLRGEVDRLRAELNEIQGKLDSSDETGDCNLISRHDFGKEFYASLVGGGGGGGGAFVATDGYDFFG